MILFLFGQQQKILRKSEEYKKLLNDKKSVSININLENQILVGTLDRKTLIEITSLLLTKINNVINKILRDANISLSDINNVLMVGGSSNMLVIREYISYITGKKIIDEDKPEMLVGLGVGLIAGMKERNTQIKDVVLTDVCPFSLGVNINNPNNPDLTIFSHIIERNSPLPVSREHVYVTTYDYQKNLEIGIYQGDNYYCKDNLCLGTVSFSVPSNLKGKEGARVRFTYNINGILEVIVTILGTNKTKKIYIQNDETNYSEEEMQKLMSQLENLKKNPADDEKNQYILEWGKRLYEENMNETRKQIELALRNFEYALNTQQDFRIRKAYKICEEFFTKIEEFTISDTLNNEFIKNFIIKMDDEDIAKEEKDMNDFKNLFD